MLEVGLGGVPGGGTGAVLGIATAAWARIVVEGRAERAGTRTWPTAAVPFVGPGQGLEDRPGVIAGSKDGAEVGMERLPC